MLHCVSNMSYLKMTQDHLNKYQTAKIQFIERASVYRCGSRSEAREAKMRTENKLDS